MPLAAALVRAQDQTDQQPTDQEQTDTQSGLAYETKIEGISGSLKSTAEESLNLYRLKDRKPSSLAALRARLSCK